MAWIRACGGGESPIPEPAVFEYNGAIQQYVVPKTGTYKLEVWGAEGGGDNCWAQAGSTNYYSRSGKGGYAKGNVNLTKDEVIYVCVGGQGQTYTIPLNATSGALYKSTGGYNGGGDGYSTGRPPERLGYSAAGGGATHIGRSNAILKETTSENVLIVAGGGGGGGTANGTIAYYGGNGGGATAGNGTNANSSYSQSIGGGGSYGQGNSYSSTPYGGGGGGGGYYGGGASLGVGGAGGTGYIGGCIPDTTEMSIGMRSGNGRATITWVSA